MSLDEVGNSQAKKSHGLFEIPYIHANTANTCQQASKTHAILCDAKQSPCLMSIFRPPPNDPIIFAGVPTISCMPWPGGIDAQHPASTL
jgi:hypothetical protein